MVDFPGKELFESFFDAEEKSDPANIDRPIGSTTSFAQIIYWHYTLQHFGDASNYREQTPNSKVFAVDQGVIQTEIESIDIDRAINAPSSTFEISLLPSKNWKQIISPGDWLIIKLFNKNDGTALLANKNIVMLGNIDRVSRTKQKDPKTDKTLVRYHISGRDFGKVFEETDIFFNPFFAKTQNQTLISTTLRTHGLNPIGTPDSLISQITDVFLSASGGKISVSNGATETISSLNQWGIPSEMAKIFRPVLALSHSISLHDILDKSGITKNLPGFAQKMLLVPGSNGGLWGYLEKAANLLVNELFLEMVRDADGSVTPTLFLRPRPSSVFFQDKDGALKGTSFTLFKLAKTNSVTVSETDIHFDNLGRDDHSRFNFIWLRPKMEGATQAYSALAKAAIDVIGQTGLPMELVESVHRHGLRYSDEMLDYIYTEKTNNSEDLQVNLLKSFLHQRYDQLAYHHLYETGTIVTNGAIYAQVGKVLRIKSAKSDSGLPDKIYYVEGYKHSWKFPGTWTTDWSVTSGQWESVSHPFIDLDEDNAGQKDSTFDRTSLIKTNVPRQDVLTASQQPPSADNPLPGVIDFFEGLA